MNNETIKLDPIVVEAIKGDCAILVHENHHLMSMLQAMQKKKNAYQWLLEYDEESLKSLDWMYIPEIDEK